MEHDGFSRLLYAHYTESEIHFFFYLNHELRLFKHFYECYHLYKIALLCFDDDITVQMHHGHFDSMIKS